MEGRRVGFEAEDAQAAENARDPQVVVVEAADPVPGGEGEVGAGADGDVDRVFCGSGAFEAVEVQHAGQRLGQSGAEVGPGAEGGEGGAVDDGGGRVEGGGFGEREEELDVVVAVLEVGVREGEEGGEGEARGVGGLEGGVVEADEEGGGGGRGGGHGSGWGF